MERSYWVKLNVNGKYSHTQRIKKGKAYIVYFFEMEDDAVRFKMAWG